MVKDEARVIRATLEPYIKAGIDAFVLYDTGSTDDTMAIAQACFEEGGVQHAYIVQDPFINFAVSRNRALEYAEAMFPSATFILMPDAEWYAHNLSALLTFCEQYKDDEDSAYYINMRYPTQEFLATRLIRCRTGMRFGGAVHETIMYVSDVSVPDMYFEIGWSDGGREKSYKRWQRDIGLLYEEYLSNPESARTVFYLAQTYDCLGDYENAKEWYKKRISFSGWDEENYMARYRLAQVYERCGEWDNAFISYLSAFSLRPTRAEPLVCIAQHYWDVRDYSLCYLFARRAAEIPYPENDILFIEKEFYVYTRYHILGCVAWYVGEYEVGESAVRKALKAHPHEQQLLVNLGWYALKT